MECSNQRGEAELIGIFHLSPNENILTIALINIHYLYINHMALKNPALRLVTIRSRKTRNRTVLISAFGPAL